jgi:glycosyltransferase involved in cell wall biosynthesis
MSQAEEGSGDRPMSVWLLTNSPSPYQLDIFKELTQLVDLRVNFMRRDFRGSTPDIDPSIKHRILSAIGLPGRRDEFRLHFGAIRECINHPHDAYVLSGLYTSPTFLLCALVLWIRRAEFILWLERPSPARRRDHGWFKTAIRLPAMAIRRCLLSCLFRACSGIVCMGELARQQYVSMGVPANKLRSVPYCCDVSRFQEHTESYDGSLRDEHNLEDRIVFLFSGQLSHRKGVDTLIQAFKRVTEPAALVLLGDGPLRMSLEAMSAELENPVVFAGHRSQEELPDFFATADVFVLPSRNDGWAVVINEACAAGLPVLTSKQTGAASDLVEQDRNGFVFDCEDVEGFSTAMSTLVNDRAKRIEFGRQSLMTIQDFSVDAGAARLHTSIVELTRGEN